MPRGQCGRRWRSSGALSELNGKKAGTGKPVLAARIAIDSGPVVLDASGEIFGDVPNIAARAQALAEPGAVVVTARVHARSRVVRRRGARQPRTQRRARTGDAVPAGPSERRRPSLGAISPRWSAATSPLNVSGPETISVRAVAVRGTPRFWVRMISRAPRDEGGPG